MIRNTALALRRHGRALAVRPEGSLAIRHAGFLLVLAASALLRAGVELAYRPALFFSDSWVYLMMASGGHPVRIMPSRPSGYPLLVRLLALPGQDMLSVTLAQHLTGLIVGALVYVMLLHLRVGRAGAAIAAGLVLLNPWSLAVEQFIMAEAFFTVLLVGAIALTVTRRSSPWALLAAGALLAISCTVRTSALFAIPVWIAYLVWTSRDRRRLLFAGVGLLLPLLLYMSWHALQTGGAFDLDESQGWFLYGRVQQFADCHGATVPARTRPLCAIPAAKRTSLSPGDWIWIPGSPAQRVAGGSPDAFAAAPGGIQRSARNSSLLEHFALGIIRAHPLAYASAVGSDFLRFFRPGVSAFNDPDYVTISFPPAPLYAWLYGTYRDVYLPGYVPQVRWPAAPLVRYGRTFPDLRLLLAPLGLISLAALALPLLTRRRVRVEHAPEIFLLVGTGMAMLLASAAFVAFVLRYLIPVIPLLISGGFLATRELAALAGLRGRVRIPGSSSDQVAISDPRTPA